MFALRTSSSRFRSPSITTVFPSIVKVGWVTLFIWLYPLDRVNFAGCGARAALDAQFLIDLVRLLLFSRDGSSRAGFNAQAATFAFRLTDFRPRQRLALASAAALIEDVLFVLLAEVAHGGEDRVRRRLTQAAQRSDLHSASKFLQKIKGILIGPSFNDIVQQRQQLPCSFPAQHAFAAGFALRELHEEARDADHACALVHCHQPAGANHC